MATVGGVIFGAAIRNGPGQLARETPLILCALELSCCFLLAIYIEFHSKEAEERGRSRQTPPSDTPQWHRISSACFVGPKDVCYDSGVKVYRFLAKAFLE